MMNIPSIDHLLSNSDRAGGMLCYKSAVSYQLSSSDNLLGKVIVMEDG